MLWVYRADGATLKFDLADDGQRKNWARLESDADFQSGITGLALHYNDDLQTLTGPVNARRLRYKAEYGKRKKSIFERIIMEYDDSIISITAYRNGAVPRVTATRIKRGRIRYKPEGNYNGD